MGPPRPLEFQRASVNTLTLHGPLLLCTSFVAALSAEFFSQSANRLSQACLASGETDEHCYLLLEGVHLRQSDGFEGWGGFGRGRAFAVDAVALLVLVRAGRNLDVFIRPQKSRSTPA